VKFKASVKTVPEMAVIAPLEYTEQKTVSVCLKSDAGIKENNDGHIQNKLTLIFMYVFLFFFRIESSLIWPVH
jgi:hypothetical protein